jgi:lipopolysaccharide biosynthesis regulator YciM
MASKRRIRRKACGSKVKYSTDNLAKRAAYLTQMHAYKCPFCKQWHIGHRPSKITRAILFDKFVLRTTRKTD